MRFWAEPRLTLGRYPRRLSTYRRLIRIYWARDTNNDYRGWGGSIRSKLRNSHTSTPNIKGGFWEFQKMMGRSREAVHKEYSEVREYAQYQRIVSRQGHSLQVKLSKSSGKFAKILICNMMYKTNYNNRLASTTVICMCMVTELSTGIQ